MISPLLFTWAALGLGAYLLHLTLNSFLSVGCNTSTALVNDITNMVKRRGIQGLMSCWHFSSALCLLSAQNNFMPNSAHLGVLIRKNLTLGTEGLWWNGHPSEKMSFQRNHLAWDELCQEKKKKSPCGFSGPSPEGSLGPALNPGMLREGRLAGGQVAGCWGAENSGISGLWAIHTELLFPLVLLAVYETTLEKVSWATHP